MSRRNTKARPSGAEQLKLLRNGGAAADEPQNTDPPADAADAANQTPPPGETTPPAGGAPNESPPGDPPSTEPPPPAGALNETPPTPLPPPPEPDPNIAQFMVPLADVPEGVYVSRHVDVQLTTPQARALRCVLEGLMNHGARLANGRRVTTSADAVRFLLDLITEKS